MICVCAYIYIYEFSVCVGRERFFCCSCIIFIYAYSSPLPTSSTSFPPPPNLSCKFCIVGLSLSLPLYIYPFFETFHFLVEILFLFLVGEFNCFKPSNFAAENISGYFGQCIRLIRDTCVCWSFPFVYSHTLARVVSSFTPCGTYIAFGGYGYITARMANLTMI
jgi:hypothetical protein